MHLYVYLYIYMYMYIYIYMHACMHVYIHIYIYIYLYLSMCVYIYIIEFGKYGGTLGNVESRGACGSRPGGTNGAGKGVGGTNEGCGSIAPPLDIEYEPF